jgi:acyl-coenzyme A synthetase/AMP-(fatty) acid ligase
MLFTRFLDIVKKYPTALAINDLTYLELLNLVNDRPYTAVCEQSDWTIILDFLKAASVNKSLTILPKFKREGIVIPDTKDEFGIFLFSSGSTGARKNIWIPEKMLLANADNAIASQSLTQYDRILTVCSLNHTGGLNAQTVPGLLCGAHSIIETFNAFNFLKLLEKHKITVSHLVPVMIDALIKVDSTADLSLLRLMVAGSDCVYPHHISYWTNKGAEFIANYGMTEAGPIIINHKYVPREDLVMHSQGVLLGNTYWCESKIVDGELYLKGDAICSDDWIATGDCVEKLEDWTVYKGRKSAGCKIIPKQY